MMQSLRLLACRWHGARGAALIALTAFWASAAVAQLADQPLTRGGIGVANPSATAQTSNRYSQVAKACVDDYARFCPVPELGKPTARDEMMCLKFHKPSLTLGCRNAVKTAAAR